MGGLPAPGTRAPAGLGVPPGGASRGSRRVGAPELGDRGARSHGRRRRRRPGLPARHHSACAAGRRRRLRRGSHGRPGPPRPYPHRVGRRLPLGAGFSLGAGALYSPAEVVSAPLPALPVLGALPNPESPPLPALGYVYLVAGAFMGLYLHRRSRTGEGGSSLPAALAAAGAATAMTIGVFALLSALASGGFGPGRFAADVGPHTGAFLAALAWQCFAPAALIITCAHRATRRGAAAVVARACRLVRGQAPQ